MTMMICNHPTLDGTPCQNPIALDSEHCAAGHPLDHSVRITSEFPGGYIAEPVDWERTVDEEEIIGHEPNAVFGEDAMDGLAAAAPQIMPTYDPYQEIYDERSAWGGDPWEQLSDEEIDLKRRNIADQLELDSWHDLPGASLETIAKLQRQDRDLAAIQRRRLEALARESGVFGKVTIVSDHSMVKRSGWTKKVKGAESSWTGGELRTFARDIPGKGHNYGYGLRGAKLPKATIVEADLGGVFLEDADLRQSTIFRSTGDNSTSFKSSDLRSAKIQESSLTWANFAHTDMRESELRDVDFRYADLQFADFRGAILSGVDFSTAVVSSADFRGAIFENCKFRGAVTSGALFDEDVNLKAMSLGPLYDY